MYPINPVFEDFLQRRGRTWDVSVTINDTTYGMNTIVDFTIENSLAPGSDFTIGAVVSSSMTLKMRILEDLPIGAKVVPYVTLSAEDLTWLQAEYEWEDVEFTWLGGGLEGMPLGEFYIDTRSRVNDVWVFTCLDKLVLANSDYISGLTYPTSMQDVWDEICDELELVSDSSIYIDPTYTVGAGPAGYTIREVMSFIASANCSSVFIGKDGKVKFRRFEADESHVFSLDTSDYFRLRQTNPKRTFTSVEVVYDEEDKLSYTAGTGNENETIKIVNPLVTQDIVDDMYVTLDGYSFVPVEMDVRGFPQVEVGDRILFAKQESQSWLDTITAWEDTNITWEGKTYHETIVTLLRYSFSGGLGMSCKTVSKSIQQSEFNNPKVLEQQVNRQTQNAIRYDKPYFGVTHSRTEGIVVQREDGLSKLTLNSDEMDWQVGGVSSLYYDALANKIKFTGRLDGVDGTFSGTLSAATIIGSTIQGGSIWGSYIATSATYPRAEMSDTSDIFGAYSTANRYARIEANPNLFNAPMMNFGFDGITTFLTQSSSDFHIWGPSSNILINGIRTQVSGAFRMAGHIDIGSVSVPGASDPDDAVTSINVLIAYLSSMGILA